jgi:hypothetical protein
MTLEAQAALAQGYRRLAAAVLVQALEDELAGGVCARWLPRLATLHELATFWSSEWLEALCEWLDLEPAKVRQLVSEVRDGRGHMR